jgi:hypothetical protein
VRRLRAVAAQCHNAWVPTHPGFHIVDGEVRYEATGAERFSLIDFALRVLDILNPGRAHHRFVVDLVGAPDAASC